VTPGATTAGGGVDGHFVSVFLYDVFWRDGRAG
jgi:hypothetical protein